MARTVAFAQPESARDAQSDEREVMRAFHSHVNRCDTCYNALASWDSRQQLCGKGHSYVQDMRPYFYEKNGKVYSKTDKKYKGSTTRVLVPSEYKNVTTFFAAQAEGLLTKPRPVVVTQSTAPPVKAPEPQRYTVVPAERYSRRSEPRSERRSERYYEKRSPQPDSRGSLYYEDLERRRTRPRVVVAEPTRYHI